MSTLTAELSLQEAAELFEAGAAALDGEGDLKILHQVANWIKKYQAVIEKNPRLIAIFRRAYAAGLVFPPQLDSFVVRVLEAHVHTLNCLANRSTTGSFTFETINFNFLFLSKAAELLRTTNITPTPTP